MVGCGVENRSDGADDESSLSVADLTDFRNLLHELKAEGCNLLVVGDARRDLFTRASARLLGDADADRYRLLAVTDASARSVADRLPDPETTPQSLSATTRLVNHSAPTRSLSSGNDANAALAEIPEVRVDDAELSGLESALADSIAAFDRRANGLGPAELRVGVDSLAPLLDHYGEGVVGEWLGAVTERVRAHDAMGHYVLPKPYDSETVQSLAGEFDAVIEVRSVDPERRGHDAEERWHVPDRDLVVEWVPL